MDFFRSHIQNGFSSIINNLPFPDECDSLGCVISEGCLARKDRDKYLKEITDITNSYNQVNNLTIKTNLKYLNDILSFCKNNCVKPLIVILPLSKDLNDKMNKDINNTFKKVVKQYHDKGIEIFNYMESDLFVIEDFQNPNHLNRIGAIKFTNLLNKRLSNCMERDCESHY